MLDFNAGLLNSSQWFLAGHMRFQLVSDPLIVREAILTWLDQYDGSGSQTNYTAAWSNIAVCVIT